MEQIDLNTNWSPLAMEGRSGRTRALLVAINYVGTQGELKGCHNDALAMREYLMRSGYSGEPNCMRLLMDDGK